MLIDKSTDVNKKSSRRAKSNVIDYLNSDKKSKNTTTGIQKIIHHNDLNDISSDDEIKMMKSIFSSQKVNNKKKSNKINELELHDKLTEEDISESSSDYEIEKIKHPAGRKKKTDKYIVERKQMLEKIQNILGITETNKVFYLYDIDSNKTKQDKINELKNMIELYFKLCRSVLAGSYGILLTQMQSFDPIKDFGTNHVEIILTTILRPGTSDESMLSLYKFVTPTN